ncbi:MAG TPA: hypothetical protein VLC91_02875 [Spongiibacteraceae bacterium]|nr:hypothetical protein [Spongiibacteraceae bacterium]
MQSKYLVVYYSRTGSTRAIAVALAKALHCDIEAIVDTNKRSGIWGYLRCVLDTLEKRSATIAPPKKNISGYELVIVGTPVWAGSVAAPVRAYLKMQKGRLPLLAFFLHAPQPRRRNRLCTNAAVERKSTMRRAGGNCSRDWRRQLSATYFRVR